MTTVLVVSCWKYRDAWPATAESLRRYWPDCPWRRILVTDCTDPHAPVLAPFRDRFTLGADLGWCANLQAAIHSGVYEPPYLLLQEDFFLTREVDTDVLAEAAKLVEHDPTIGCFRLTPCPGPLDETERGRVGCVGGGVPYGEVHLGEPYRVSCQAAFWSTRFILRALAVGTSRGGAAEQFELGGPETCRLEPCRVLSVLRSASRLPIEYLCTAVVRGRWSRDAVRLIREWGLDPGTRAVEEA